MRKFFILIISMFLLSSVSLFAGLLDEELIVNGGIDDSLNNWDMYSLVDSMADYNLDTNSVITGKNSIHVNVYNSFAPEWDSGRIQLNQHNIPGGIVSGQEYTISFKLKANKAHENCFWSIYKESDWTQGTVGNHGWAYVSVKEDTVVSYEYTYVADETVADAYFAFDFGSIEPDSVEFWIDDVSILKVVEPAFAGSGTEADPFQIATMADLDTLSKNSVYWETYLIQTADIDASVTKNWGDTDSTNEGWSAIGNGTTKFTGSYDGGGFAIDSLYINRPSGSYNALIGYARNAKIKNVKVTNVDIIGGNYSAGLAGYVSNETEIDNCVVTGTLEFGLIPPSGAGSCGGVVGRAVSDAVKITNSNCDVYVNANIVNAVGAFIGRLDLGTVEKCYSKGELVSENYLAQLGGFVGKAYGGTINECYNLADINLGVAVSATQVGAFVGKSKNTISNSYSISNITSLNKSADISGFAGYLSGSLENCYAVGTVQDDTTGGSAFLGDFDEANGATTTACFYDSDVSGGIAGVGATAKTTAEMKTRTTFTDASWDFSSVWKSSSNYPNLRNNSNPDLEPELGPGLNAVKPAGSGTEADPFLVDSLANLSWVIQNSDSWDSYFVQTSDIVVASTVNWDDSDDNEDGDLYNDEADGTDEGNNEGWSPIGNSDTPFIGTYDGGDFVLEGLTINRPTTQNIGFFGVVIGAKIEKLNFVDVAVEGTQNVGGLVALVQADSIANEAYISDCSIVGGSVSSKTSTYGVGGLIGVIDDGVDAFVENCETNVTVKAEMPSVATYSGVGGFIGWHSGGGTIINCNSKGAVDNTGSANKSHCGGFAGMIASMVLDSTLTPLHIYRCYALGEVLGTRDLMYAPQAGFAGMVGHGTVEQCFSTGDVTTAGDKSGGFAGYVRNTGKVKDCFSTGNVTRIDGSSKVKIGAFVGNLLNADDYVNNCYATGKVVFEGTSVSDKGFIASYGAGDTLANFFDSTSTGQTVGIGATALSTEEMMADSNFINAGWDFTDVWEIVGANYPSLIHNRLPVVVMPTKMTFEVSPHALSDTKISMTTTEATASGHEIAYLFECVTDPSHSSSWQTSRTYVDSSLTMNTVYEYTVKAKVVEGTEESQTSDAIAAKTDYINTEIKYNAYDGMCAMEAENGDIAANGDFASYQSPLVQFRWDTDTTYTGFIGKGYSVAPEGFGADAASWDNATILKWRVNIKVEGEYYIAIRRNNDKNRRSQNAYYGVDGVEKRNRAFSGTVDEFKWVRGDSSLGLLTVGEHAIEIRRQQDGLMIDRVMIATSLDALPADGSTEAGPDEDIYTSINEEEGIANAPVVYRLEQNYPNPFNPTTMINFSIQKAGQTELTIYNVLGQKVVTLVNKELTAGNYQYKFNASRFASGIYFYKLQSNGFVKIKKMMLLK